MNWKRLISPMLLVFLFSPAADAGCRDPFYKNVLIMAVYEFALQDEGNWGTFVSVMYSQGYNVDIQKNTSGGSDIPDCGINKFAWYWDEDQKSYRGILLVITHGNSVAAEHEAFLTEAARNGAWEVHKDEGWTESQMIKATSISGYGIALYPTTVNFKFAGGNEEIVFYYCCYSADWVRSGYSDARVVIGAKSTVNRTNWPTFNAICARLDGQSGQTNRTVQNAFTDTTLFCWRGNGATVLAPSVIEVSPAAGTIVSGPTAGYVKFDTDMKTDGFAPVTADDNATIDRASWAGSTKVQFTITPFAYGSFNMRVTTDAVSRGGGVIDGNQDPAGTNAQGPNRDEYVYLLASTVGDGPNTAASFEGAWAFRDEAGVHVLWVTDPELGSISFEVWAGENRAQLLTTVPAAGSPILPHFYEVVVQSDATTYEVVETDDDPTTDYGTRPFPLSNGSPDNLDGLRQLNSQVLTWTPTPITPITDDFGTRDYYPPTDFVYYTSSLVFPYFLDPVIQWWAERGRTSQVIIGSPDANEARARFKSVFESAVQEQYPRRPICIIAGEANQGSDPGMNVVSTFYVPDEDGQCYWSSCASDLTMVDFYGNGPECAWSRLPVHEISKLINMDQTTLEYYGGIHVPSPRAVALVGDRNNFCTVGDSPRLLFNEVCGWYQAAGLPTLQLNESDYDCSDYVGKKNRVIGESFTELIGTGEITNRSILPGYFIQKVIDPVFTASDLATMGRKRFVVELPGCGMGDTDRDNPDYYPSLPAMFITADPNTGASAVAWLSHSRGGDEDLHHRLAREYFKERTENGWKYTTVQELYTAVIRKLWHEQHAMRPYLKLCMAYGYPVALPDMLGPTAVPVDLPIKPELQLTNAPNPFRSTTLTYALPGLARVRLAIYDLSSRCVRTLIKPNQVADPGTYQVAWDGQTDAGHDAAPGMYFARLELNGQIAATRKLTLLK